MYNQNVINMRIGNFKVGDNIILKGDIIKDDEWCKSPSFVSKVEPDKIEVIRSWDNIGVSISADELKKFGITIELYVPPVVDQYEDWDD